MSLIVETRKDSSKRREIIKFLAFFIVIFLALYIGLNFAAFYKNLKYEIFEALPAQVEVVGEAAVSDISENEIQEEERPILYNKPNSVVIPKIEVKAPIVIPKSSGEKDILLALKEGVAINPDSMKPGKKGITVISGHSSPHLVYSGKYDTVFSLLNKLEKGDKITIYFKKQRFIYKVKNKYIFYPDEAVLPPEDKSKSTLILMSCWPVGTDWKRIAIESELTLE